MSTIKGILSHFNVFKYLSFVCSRNSGAFGFILDECELHYISTHISKSVPTDKN